MERREFGYLAVLAILPGCSTTVSNGPSQGNQSSDETTTQEDVSGFSEDGIDDLDAFLDAQRAAAKETSHTFALTETAEDTFEDGYEALELRTQYDPSTERLHLQRWWRYPDGDRGQIVEIYTDGSGAGERTVVGEDDVRLEPVSTSAPRERYTRLRETVRGLLAAMEYGPVEDVSGDAGASYRLPITGVGDVEDESPVHDVGSGHLLLTGGGLVRSGELLGLVPAADRERKSDLEFEVTNVGETSVSEPDWFGEVPEATTVDGGAGGDGGSAETTESDTTETTVSDPQTTTPSGAYETVVVGPDGEHVFEPEVLRIEPGTTVRWVWESDNHDVKPEDQPPGADWEGFTEISDAGTEYQYTFEVEGTYTYSCRPHAAVGMEGEIIVESQ